jgi:hypothetical protein
MTVAMTWLRNIIASIRLWWQMVFIDERFIEDFEETFPGQCVICSLHRAMLREGYQEPLWAHEPCQERAVRELRP